LTFLPADFAPTDGFEGFAAGLLLLVERGRDATAVAEGAMIEIILDEAVGRI